jgi:hypothetical protein
MTERILAGKVNLRGFIYKEEHPWETRWFVGKEAPIPCVVHYHFQDSIPSNTTNIVEFDNLGWFSPSSSHALQLAVAEATGEPCSVHQDDWRIRVYSAEVSYYTSITTWSDGSTNPTKKQRRAGGLYAERAIVVIDLTA